MEIIFLCVYTPGVLCLYKNETKKYLWPVIKEKANQQPFLTASKCKLKKLKS